MEKVAFCALHGLQIQMSVAQEVSHLMLSSEKWQEYERGPAYSGVEEGHPYVCAGILESWHGRWLAWAAISHHAGPREMLWIHRQTRKFLVDLQALDSQRYRRIEATARVDEPEAQRWLEMLGFVKEGRLRCYDASGLDHFQYARIPCHLIQVPQPQ